MSNGSRLRNRYEKAVEKNLLYVAFMLQLSVEVKPRRIRIYETENGKRPFEDWVKSIKNTSTIRRIQARLAGVIAGNLGDMKPVGSGVMELRLFFGSGYRIYFGIASDDLIILLLGGDKSLQNKDIQKAKKYWSDFRSKNNE